MRAVVALVVLAGCDQLFELGHLTPPPIDAPPPDAPRCTAAAPSDSFDSDPPCGAWGQPDVMNATIAIANGALAIMPAANNANTRGGCIGSGVSSGFVSFTDMAVVVSRLPDGSEYQEFDLVWDTGDTTSIQWGAQIEFVHQDVSGVSLFDAHVAFDSVQTRWVRARPNVGTIAFETSPDGVTWTTAATETTAPPAMVRIFMYGGTFAAEPSPQTIYYDGLNCP